MEGKFKMKGSSFYGKSPFKKNGVDMKKLRSKQRRASKGISEFKHFSDPNTQGDEPNVEGTHRGSTQTTDFSGKKIYGDVKIFEHKYKDKNNPKKTWKGHGPGMGDLKKGYPKWRKLTQQERANWIKMDEKERSTW
tara:strand:- start:85 stop:492 length:408 start_codon:yes stop_codon:yes gene_type:complete